jgi:hypothetical protein
VRRIALMALLMVGTMGEQRGTVSYLTSTAASNANAFVAGKVELGATPAVSGLMTFTAQYPGAQEYGSITVGNTGTVSLRYAISNEKVSGDDELKSGLKLTVKTGAGGTCNATGFSSYATTLYATSDLVPATSKIVGDTTVGSQAGDRTLTPGTSETLCFSVSLPETADTGTQGKTIQVKFTFASEQLSGT